ncbi:MAG: sirohydrochlorin cobaltochelatase [Chthoniobacter sp.]|jgi:sirohydrochlorin cobaltochelatase|nr:sirohydrochlorin cobaltochelatase [Chthoniobacter sp.]
MRDVTQALAAWLEDGGRQIGEIVIHPVGGGFALCHRDDVGREDLASTSRTEAARELANHDDAGKFRPLKTAPNLRHGWRLTVPDLAELRRALDYFYPAMLGVWCSHRRGELPPVPLRETLGRQSGMYRVTQKITDAAAQEMIGGFCRSEGGCLKHPLWEISPGQPIATLPAEKLQSPAARESWPLLCPEACNLLVAKAREVVKKSDRKE